MANFRVWRDISLALYSGFTTFYLQDSLVCHLSSMCNRHKHLSIEPSTVGAQWTGVPFLSIVVPNSHKYLLSTSVQFSSVAQSCPTLFVTPWTAACQASLSITNSRSLPKLMSIELVMPSNHLILCRPLLLLPSIFPSIRVFSSESVLRIKWPKYYSFSFHISPSNEHLGLISFRMDWLDLLLNTYYVPSIIADRTVNKSLSLCLHIFRRGDNRITNHNVIWKTEKCYEKNKIWSWDRVTSKGRKGDIFSPKVVRHCLTEEVGAQSGIIRKTPKAWLSH